MTTKNELCVMDPVAGDLKTVWDADNADEVDAAREQFDSMKRKGYLAFTVGEGGEKGEEMREFDPDAEAIIMAPMPRGG